MNVFRSITPVRETLNELFASDPTRADRYVGRLGELRIDWSRQPVNDDVLRDLRMVARKAGLSDRFSALMSGAVSNVTEGRRVLHSALRAPSDRVIDVDGHNVVADVHAVLNAMSTFAARIRSDERITDIVNIGIGGSDLGPAMAAQALQAYRHPRLRAHFVSNVDGADLARVLAEVRPESTLFIVVSKTFTTIETLTNARTARTWLVSALGESAVRDHFVAVSTAEEKVVEFGIDPASMFGFWEWVGGRYSVWSAVGLSLMVLIGGDAFRELLAGGHDVDEHMRLTLVEHDRLDDNIVVTLAMIGVLHRNVLERTSKAVLPYAQELARFPAYLQQLDMESNGKRVTERGEPVDGATGPIIWGEPGTNGQHAFYQLLHQGTDVVPVDFIGFARPHHDLDGHHDLLMANLFAQAQALAFGRASATETHRHFPGDRPSTLILAPQLTPRVLGQLIAMYEHLVYVQGVIWGIDSFDQWGVELGKELATGLAPLLAGESANKSSPTVDPATAAAVQWYRDHRTMPR